MSTYSLSVRTSNATISQACWEIYTPSTLGIKIFEIGISTVTAQTMILGLAKPLAAGVGQTTPANFIPEQDSNLPTSKTLSAVAWGTSAPTIATAGFLRRVSIVSAIGAGIIWTFPRGLYVPPSTSMCIHNISASTGFLDCWAVIDE